MSRPAALISQVAVRRLATALVAVTALTVVVGASARTSAGCTVEPGWGSSRPDLAAQVVRLVNAHRSAKGLGALKVSRALTASSSWKSLHMAGNGYFGHDDPAPPGARSAYRRALDCGYTGSRWGENIAYGYTSASAALNAWLGSSGHRANIETAGYTTIGVGVADRDGTLYWTQNFGNDTATATVPSDGASRGAPPRPSTPSAASGGTATVRSAELIGALPARTVRSGSRLVAAVPFVQLGTKRRVVSGGVRCRAEVGGRRLRVVVNAFRNRRATCAWLVPKAATGSVLVGIVAVQIGGTAAIRHFERVVE